MTKLKPCPFCGGEDIKITNHGAYWVICQNDECLCEMRAQVTEEKAIQKWNERVNDDD